MRAKDIWALVPVPSHVVKKVYSGVTLSKITALYFLFALLHMFVQGGLQVASHMTNQNANGVLEAIRSKASVKGQKIPVITPNRDGSGDTLRVCEGIPQSNADQTCQPIFNAPSNPRPKHNQDQDQDQGARTTAPLDNVLALSDSSLASQTPASSASPATSSVIIDATKVANGPVGVSTRMSPPSSFANAVPPATSAPAPSPSPSPVSAPALGRGVPSRVVVPSVPAPSTTAQATSQAPAPPSTQSSEPPVFVISASQANRLPISIALPDLVFAVNSENKSNTVPVESSTHAALLTTAQAPSQTSAPPPAQSSDPPVFVLSESQANRLPINIALPDLVSAVNNEDKLTTVPVETSTPAAPSTTTQANPVFSILSSGQPETISNSTQVTETSATSTVSASVVETPAGSIGSLNVGKVRVDDDLPSSGQPQTTPAPQPTEATPAPVPDVSQSSTPPEHTLNGTTESVSAKAAKETTETAQGPTNTLKDTTESAKTVIGGLLGRRSLHIEPIFNQTSGKIIAVNITDLTNSGSDEVIIINRTCAMSLILPHQEVRLAQKKDLVMVGYYIWLFALAFVAVINQSIPHLVAACIASVLAVVWSVFQVLHTRAFQSQFDRFITYGACDGVHLLPNYWKQRSAIEIPSLILNCVFALILSGLAFKLVSRYQKSTSKLVGGERHVGHLYKVVLVLCTVVQVTMFLIIASLALWVNQLFGGVIAGLSRTANIFKGIAIVSLVLALPWFILCWIAVRKENKALMVAFFITTMLFITSLFGMFGSDAFRLIFSGWPFFGSLTVASLVGLVLSFGLSVWCRMRFGRGLAPQLAANSKAEDELMPWDFSSSTEKAWEAYGRISSDNGDLQ